MSLYHYLVRLESLLRSRQDVAIELLQVDMVTIGARFRAEVRFFDGSRLSIFEHLELSGRRSFQRIAYKYHYQDQSDALIFRYDNSPHHPNLATFPDHKHVGSMIIDAEPPHLSEVLAEISRLIYSAPQG